MVLDMDPPLHERYWSVRSGVPQRGGANDPGCRIELSIKDLSYSHQARPF